MGRAEPKMNGLDRPGQNVQKRVYYFYFDEILIDSMIAIVTSKNFHIYSLLAPPTMWRQRWWKLFVFLYKFSSSGSSSKKSLYTAP